MVASPASRAPSSRWIDRGGTGCAISPYQEADLIFGGDRRAIGAALRRLTSLAG